MPEEIEDDRVSHFIDSDGLKSDKQEIISMLTDVLEKIKEVSSASQSLLGFTNIRQATDGIKQLNGAMDNLNKSKTAALKIAYEQAKVDLVNKKNEAAQLDVENKRVRNENSASKASIKTTTAKQSPSTQVLVNDSKAVADIKNQEVRVIELSKKYTELIAIRERLKSEGQTGSGEFILATKQAETYEAELLKIIGYTDKLKATDTTAFNAGLKAQIDIREGNQNAGVVAGDSGITDRIRQLDDLKEKLKEIDQEQETVKKNGDSGGSSSLFIRLANQADTLRGQIVALTQDLGSYVTKQAELVGEADPFQKLIAEARSAKKAFNDALTQQSVDPTVTDAFVEQKRQQWLALQNQIRDVKNEEKQALSATPNSSLQQQIQVIEKELEAANTEAAFFTAEMQRLGRTQVGRNSQQFHDMAKGLDDADTKALKLYNDLKKLSAQAAQKQQPFLPTSAPGSAERNFDKEIAAANVLNSTYAALNTQLKVYEAEAKELASKQFLGTASSDEIKRLGELRTQIEQLATGINKIDQQFTRAGANNTAYTRQLFSLQQVLRETPSLQFGFATYISAISNNLPILADDIKRIKDENKLLAASGQKTQSVWQALSASFFSWQTLLLAGISIIAIYAKEIGKFVVELFRSEEANRRAFVASKEYADLQAKLTKSTEELTKAFIKLNEIRNRSNDAGIRNLKNELSVIEALGVAAEKTFDIKNKISKLEVKSADENKEATADAVARQFNTVATNTIPDLNDKLKKQLEDARKAAAQEAEKTITTTTTSPGISGGGVSISTSQKSKEQQDRDKFNAERAAKEVEFTKQEIALGNESVQASKVFADQKLKIEADYQAGRLTLEQKTNADILNQGQFLARAQDISNRTQAFQTNKQVFREQVVQSEGQRVNKKRGDVNKDEEFIAAQKDAQAAKDAADIAGNVNKQVTEAFTKSQDVITEKQRLENEKRKTLSDEARKVAIASAHATADRIKTINEDILNDETSTQKQRLQAIRNVAAADRLVAAAEKNDVINDLGASDADKVVARKKFATTLQSIETETNRKLLDLQHDYLVRNSNANQQQLESELKTTISINDKISDSIENSFKTRIDAQKASFEAQKKILDEQFRLQLRQAGLSIDAPKGQPSQVDTFVETGFIKTNKSGEVEGSRKTLQELQALRADHESQMLELIRSSAEAQTQQVIKELEKQEKAYEDFDATLLKTAAQSNLDKLTDHVIDVTRLNKSFITGELLFKNYADRRKALDDKFSRQSIQIEIDTLQKQLQEQEKNYSQQEEAAKLHALNMALIRLDQAQARRASLPADANPEAIKAADEEVEAASRQVASARLVYEKVREFGLKIIDVKKQIKEKNVELSDAEQKTADDIVAGLNEQIAKLAEAFSALQNAKFDARQQQIQDEMDLLDKRTEKERSTIEQTIQNEEEKAKRLAELDVQSAQSKETLEKKQRKLDYDRAKAQRTAALATIAIDLAQAIAKIIFQATAAAAIPIIGPGLAALAYAQIPIAVASAALQTAAVLSTPLPKLALGTEDHKGGPVIMGDAWRSELVHEPSGKMWVTAARPTVYDLPEHSKVYPDASKALNSPVPSVKPIAVPVKVQISGLQIEHRQQLDDYAMRLNKAVNLTLKKPISAVPVLPHTPRPAVMPHPDAANIQMNNFHNNMLQSVILHSGGGSTNVSVPGMEQLERTFKKGFMDMTKALKNLPQPVSNSGGNAEKLLRYGSEYNKYLNP